MPRPGRRFVLSLAVAAAAAIALSAGVVRSSARMAWARLRDRTEGLQHEWLTRQCPRPALWGEQTRERAFDHYAAAGSHAAALECMQNGQIGKLLQLTDDALAKSPMRAGWQTALPLLRAGAHATDTSPRRNAYGNDEIANLLELRAVANAAALETAALRADGDHREAVRVSLDALTMGGDLIRDGLLINQMIGCAMLEIGLSRWTEAAVQQLPPIALAELSHGLLQLDASLPPSLDCDRELLYTASILSNAPDGADVEWAGSPGLRYGFSARWMIADAFLMFADMADDLHQHAGAPWAERQQLWQKHNDRMNTSGNAAAEVICPNLATAESSLRQTMTSMRLLRTALLLRVDPEAAPLADPFADGPLQLERLDGGVVVRSVGKRGDKAMERQVTR